MLPEPHELHLRLFPDPVLRAKASLVEAVDDRVRSLARRMIELMVQHEGIGLAAPQVGLGLRMFVADVPRDPEAPPPPPPLRGREGDSIPIETFTSGPKVYINPEIEFLDRQVSPFNEGCLSLPEIRGDVLRPETVRIRALGLDGQAFERVGAGLLARCWQHETDHLDGVLIIDKMNPVHLKSNSKRLRDLER